MKVNRIKKAALSLLLLLANVFFVTAQECVIESPYCFDNAGSVTCNPTQTFYKVDKSGRFLTRHIKNDFLCDNQGRVIKKEVSRWNAETEQWEKSYLLCFTYTIATYTIEYAKWNSPEKLFDPTTEKAVYMIDDYRLIALYHYERLCKEDDWLLNGSLSDLPSGIFLSADRSGRNELTQYP